MGVPRPGGYDPYALVPREVEVYRLVGRGMTNHEIGQVLCIHHTTVRTYIKRIYEKLGIKGRARLAIAAYKQFYEEGKDGV